MSETPVEIKEDLRMGKSERLRHKRLVDRLFQEGVSFYSYPLRVIYLEDSAQGLLSAFKSHRLPEASSPENQLGMMRIASLQMMVNVPKRKMRKAVDRVWLRRRIREAWRLKRGNLREMLRQKGNVMSVALIYVGNEKKPYGTIAQRMDHIISRIEAHVAKPEKGGEEE